MYITDDHIHILMILYRRSSTNVLASFLLRNGLQHVLKVLVLGIRAWLEAEMDKLRDRHGELADITEDIIVHSV